MKKALGICLGATTITMAEAVDSGNSILINKKLRKFHEGDPKKLLREYLSSNNINSYQNIIVTGRKFKDLTSFTAISECEAIEEAYSHFCASESEKYKIIISAGGEAFLVYYLSDEGKIISVQTGNKCASGTGEFFLQQIRRMALTLPESIELARKNEPANISGRCSVFCKSDCTHALNIGHPKGEIIAGLCSMMKTKVTELIKQKDRHEKMLVIGGTSLNEVFVDCLKKDLVNLDVARFSDCFEAAGSALWALKDKKPLSFNIDGIFKSKHASSFSFLPPLKEAENLVTFMDFKKGEAIKGDICLLGLDVGSTTTKAVIVREKDNAMLASIYLRTSGDPVGASRKCYEALKKQIKNSIEIIGLGVTGSGRHISGLHAMTPAIINEIIAHARAAAYFDESVDTILEIGGQDAKYTYLTSSVPSDYAMNEACSAGTGSFLEEAAKESLGMEMTDIASVAMQSKNPPNFNDQCAAFISSDIKTAFGEGLSKEDIVGGLVYSICMNYNNRVKGNRPVGKRVFMQGGVCYNKAVPIAMASLMQKEVIVPPEPGLMGAFGVALEIKDRISRGQLEKIKFELSELSAREVTYGRSFICTGGKSRCDRKCNISIIKTGGKNFTFGGACNKYYNQTHNIKVQEDNLNFVEFRQSQVFREHPIKVESTNTKKPRIGISRSFLVNTFYPLFYHFFKYMSCEVVVSSNVSPLGIDKKGSAFCYPAEIAHGLMEDLIEKNCDYIFLPHIVENYASDIDTAKRVCVLVQGEPYYIKSSFSEDLNNTKVFTPVLNFAKGYEAEKLKFVEMAKSMGLKGSSAREAFKKAVLHQNEFEQKIKEKGSEILKELETEPDRFSVILFGRSYNAFAQEANMGIPNKFASRGIKVIPCDMVPVNDIEVDPRMYWASGQVILKVAQFVKKHPQLFGVYVTNFSCGPDSFLLTFFRDIMGKKPSLTLELDGHTADAGLNTRIDAFIDIVERYIKLERELKIKKDDSTFNQAQFFDKGRKSFIINSAGKKYDLYDPNVTILFPSMGDLNSQAIADSFCGFGLNAKAVNPPAHRELVLGREATLCKECLPMILTAGSLIRYYEEEKKPNESIVYFMPNTTDPCRFGQYHVLFESIIKKYKLDDVAVFSISDRDGYAGLGNKFLIRAWKAMVISSCMDEIRNAISVLAKEPDEGLKLFYKNWEIISKCLREGNSSKLYKALSDATFEFSQIPLNTKLSDAKHILLTGEIYVRSDGFSRQYIVEKLSKKGFVTKVTPIYECIYYADYSQKNNYSDEALKGVEKLGLTLKSHFQTHYEKKIKNIFKHSGLYHYDLVDVEDTIEHSKHLVSPYLRGETSLTVGCSLREIMHDVCGVISIGPFGCMPSRVSEAILSTHMTKTGKNEASKTSKRGEINIENTSYLPFLSIESDGNPFPAILEAKLEAFCLQAGRLHDKIKTHTFH